MVKISQSPSRSLSKAIRVPFGDHFGHRSPKPSLTVSWTGSPPPASTTYTSASPSVVPEKAIRVPSGDQEGTTQFPMSRPVTWTRSVPSAAMVNT